jgi:hypothetical protein
MKKPRQKRVRHTLLGSLLALANLAHAGVIQGSGSAPSATRLGVTDAVGIQTSDSGPGHMLVVPYFSAQNGQMSVLHLVNTDLVNGKAVKLRFRGAANGDSLLSFYVLMSPGDVWTGAVTMGADGRAQLLTADNTCTYPRLTNGVAQPFATSRLNPVWSPTVQANHTREGMVDAIVAADIPSASVYGISRNASSALFAATRPINTIAPCTVATLDEVLLNDFEVESSAAEWGLAAPTGGVSGSWYIIDVPGSTTFSGAATAFRAVNVAGKPARSNYMVFPQNSVGVNQPERFTADPLLVSAGLAGRTKDASGNLSGLSTTIAVRALNSDLPDLSTPSYLPASALNARITAGDLSKTLAATSVSNQYATDAPISAKTDWVLSMPTKRYSAGIDYSQSTSPPMYSAVPPAALNSQYFYSNAAAVTNEQVCTPAGVDWQDREGTLSPQFVILGIPTFATLCGATSVLSFVDSGRSALAASVARQTINSNNSFPIYTNGWGAITMNTTAGLPILGASFIKLSNPSAQPGVSGNYGITWPHGYTR